MRRSSEDDDDEEAGEADVTEVGGREEELEGRVLLVQSVPAVARKRYPSRSKVEKKASAGATAAAETNAIKQARRSAWPPCTIWQDTKPVGR